MPIKTNEKGVHVIYQGEEIVGFFTRDEKSNENVIFMAQKASLDEIKGLFNSVGDNKI